MLATDSLIELEPIVDDISLIIKKIMRTLDSLHRKEEEGDPLSQLNKQFAQLKGTFTMLNMQGALSLSSEAEYAANHLASIDDEQALEKTFQLISDALAILSRYVEYVSQKTVSSPQLLLPIINQLRKNSQLPALKESVFFVLPENLGRNNSVEDSDKNADFGGSVLDFSVRDIRHLRQMFQIGLIEVIRRSNLKGGFKMMRRSLVRVSEKYANHSFPDLWVAAQCMVEGYLSGELKVNSSRIKILSYVDQQYRMIELQDSKKSQANNNKTIMGEMLFLIGLSRSEDSITKALKQKYQLYNNRVDDHNFKPSKSILKEPTVKDLQSLSHEILDELKQVERLLETLKGSNKGADSLLIIVENLSSLLIAVQLADESAKLDLVSAILHKVVISERPISDSDFNISFSIVSKLILLFEKQDVSILLPTRSSGRKQLNEEQRAACRVARQHIDVAATQFDLSVCENTNLEPLKLVVAELAKAKEGMSALKLTPLIRIADESIALVKAMIAKPKVLKGSQVSAQLLADAIGSLAFYLETFCKNRTPSPRVIEFASESIKELKLLAAKE